MNKSSAISFLPSVDGDSWFGTTQVSLARNSRLIKWRTFVRSQMSVSIALLIINFMSWNSFSIINVDKSDSYGFMRYVALEVNSKILKLYAIGSTGRKTSLSHVNRQSQLFLSLQKHSCVLTQLAVDFHACSLTNSTLLYSSHYCGWVWQLHGKLHHPKKQRKS